MRIDGTIEQISEPHLEFGRAVANAVENGFKPKHDAYVVIAGGTYTHFRPGERPITIPPDARAGAPGNDVTSDPNQAAASPITDAISTRGQGAQLQRSGNSGGKGNLEPP